MVNFKNTIIIMTSNIGSHIIQENFEGLERKNMDEVIEKTQREVMDLLRKTVRPEFLNRVVELIMFRPPAQPIPCPPLSWLRIIGHTSGPGPVAYPHPHEQDLHPLLR